MSVTVEDETDLQQDQDDQETEQQQHSLEDSQLDGADAEDEDAGDDEAPSSNVDVDGVDNDANEEDEDGLNESVQQSPTEPQDEAESEEADAAAADEEQRDDAEGEGEEQDGEFDQQLDESHLNESQLNDESQNGERVETDAPDEAQPAIPYQPNDASDKEAEPQAGEVASEQQPFQPEEESTATEVNAQREQDSVPFTAPILDSSDSSPTSVFTPVLSTLRVERPPLPIAELDYYRNLYLGLKVISSGKVDSKVEGIQGKHWVTADSLPQYSENNCEHYFPYQRKRICFEMNKQNIITWIRYA